MFWTFLYLTRCTIRNRFRRRIRRLREPRYLIGLVVGGLYFYLMLFRGRSRPSAGTGAAAMVERLAAPMAFLGGVLLLAVAAGAWLWPGSGKPIAFSRAEVQFLFPAPVTRRDLLHYKLLRSQLGLLFASAATTLVMRPSTLAGGWTMLVGVWLVFLIIRLHLMGVALTRASLAEHGRSALVRQWLPLAVILAAAGMLASAVIRDWATLAALPDAERVFAELQRLSLAPPASLVLWPFRAVMRVPLAASPAAFWSALPPVIVLIALNYVWVLRADAAFEEASAEHAETLSRGRATPKPVARGATATPFQLAADGPAETAILWKNLIMMGRYVSLRTLWRLIPLVVAFGIIAQSGGAKGLTALLAGLCLPLAAFAVLVGPQMMRNDLRHDLASLATLKTWPVRGAAIIRGEVLAPTVVVTAVAWLLILTAALLVGELSAGSRAAFPPLMDRVSYAAAALIVAPALILSQTVVQNALAVLFPAWVTVGSARTRGGLDVMGQRLLLMAGNLLALAISVVPGAAIAGLVMLAVLWLTGVTIVVVPALIAAAVVVAECWVATEWLGRVLERTDVTAVDAVE